MGNRSILTISVLLVLLAGAGAACSGDDGGTAPDDPSSDSTPVGGAEPVRGGTVVFGLVAENNGYNPTADQINLSGYQVTRAIYDTLTALDPEGQWHPYLAEALTPNQDFTEWEIQLRPDVMFHDGTPLDASVLKLNLDTQKDSPLLGQALNAVESVDVVDDLTVSVVMDSPWSSFPYTLTAQPGIIAAPSVIEDADGSLNPVGTGPFVLEEWIVDNHLTVSRNDGYWREGYPLLDGIEFRILADAASRSASLQSGDVDIVEVRNGGLLAEFEGSEDPADFVVLIDEAGETPEEVVFMNTAVAPFDDPVAREAVTRAIDAEAYSEVLTDGRFPPADGPFRDGSPWDRGVEFPGYDPELAAEVVAEYEAAHGVPLSFVFKSFTTPAATAQAGLIQQQLSEVGIEMTIETGEPTVQLVEIILGDYQSGTANLLWGSQHPDIESVFLRGENALPPGEMGIAFTRISNPRIDEALIEARATPDRTEQADQWQIIQEELASDMNWVFLTHDDIGAVADAKVQDPVDWEFPDGTPGKPQTQNILSVYQMWLEG